MFTAKDILYAYIHDSDEEHLYIDLGIGSFCTLHM